MHTFKVVLIYIMLLSLFIGSYFVVPILATCNPLGTQETRPGNRAFFFRACDPNGNYYGNFLRMRYDLNAPGSIHVMEWLGMHVWEKDPNYLVIDNAIYDPNSSEPNLYGIFGINRNWGHEDWILTIHVFDKADNNGCGTCTISSRDKGKPKVIDTWSGKRQK